ncbi:hypothetical protein ACQ4PT_069256 [Festuca glaucescens]
MAGRSCDGGGQVRNCHRITSQIVIAAEAVNLDKGKYCDPIAYATNVADVLCKLNLKQRGAMPFVVDDDGMSISRARAGAREKEYTLPSPRIPTQARGTHLALSPKSSLPNQIPTCTSTTLTSTAAAKRRDGRRGLLVRRVGRRRRRGQGGRLGLRRLRQPQLRLPLPLQPLQAAAPPRRPPHPARLQVAPPRRRLDLQRKNCKKCGLPKEEAAMPAMGGLLPAYADYMARVQQIENAGYKMNFGMPGNSALQQQLLAHANWQYGMAGRYGMQSSAWQFGGNSTNQFQGGAPKDWRDGDWLCSCGFHNYSSRTQCKECNAPVPSGMASTTMKTTGPDTSSTLGNKRLASEELANDWDNKRLNPGNADYPLSMAGSDRAGQTAYSGYDNGHTTALPSGQISAMPGVVGQGAKWREGDWMCSNCNNHNYASRSFCNRCKSQKESSVHPGAL